MLESRRVHRGRSCNSHSYTNNVRYSVIENIEEYIKNIDTDNEADNIIFHEKQNKDSKMQEYMLLGLRKIEGIKIQEFKNKFETDPIVLYKNELKKLKDEGLIKIDSNSIKLTNKGLDLANIGMGGICINSSHLIYSSNCS